MKSRIMAAPLGRKLRLAVMTASVASVLLAGAALSAVHFYSFRKEFHRGILSIASATAGNCAASISMNRRDEVENILAETLAVSDVRGAKILLPDGSEFAKSRGTGSEFPGYPFTAQASSWWEDGDLLHAQPVMRNDTPIAMLLVMSDYSARARRLAGLYLGCLIGSAVIAALVGLAVSNRFAHRIVEPLGRIGCTIRRIASSADYSIRAEKSSDDEVGAFADSFNAMLEQIEARDGALRHEIAERERAERELQIVHAKFVDTSHQAGMAEVATGVLHNVGNVLNSVNVSANVITEKLNPARLNNLIRTANLLQEKSDSLAEFLTSDPKGRLIPVYLADLSRHLANQRQEALVELDLLTRNIEHIKEIVSMQQDYARVTGLTEPMPPEALVEDALRMTVGGLERHGIKVIRNYETNDPILGERHKVLQILVNLIRNAQRALDEGAPALKQLSLRVRHIGSDTVSITVSDNGLGIPPENLTRIFSHGFTTRKDGHGFGLHSAALAAQQMGGRIVAHSDGPSLGAAFSLELPIAQLEVAA